MADARPNRLSKMKKLFSLDEAVCFSDWKDLAARPKMADVAVVATQDRMHKDPAIALAKLGYHLLLEKVSLKPWKVIAER